jgi:hypothetical protein
MISITAVLIRILILSVIAFLTIQLYYGVLGYLKSIYISIRLTWKDNHDYFFSLMEKLMFKKGAIVSFKGSFGEYLITIADGDGITYFVDINLTKSKFNMRMNSKFVSCFIFGEDLIYTDIKKFNRLVELGEIKESTRKFLNDLEIEILKNKK